MISLIINSLNYIKKISQSYQFSFYFEILSIKSVFAIAYSVEYILHKVSQASFYFSLIRLAASQLRGESSLGFYMSRRIALQSESNVHVGHHYDLMISRHTQPVLKWMLGWNIFVLKYIFGGVMGYSLLSTIFTWNIRFS